MRSTVYVVVLLLILSACSDPKAATEENFRQALEAFYAQPQNHACIDINATFPYERTARQAKFDRMSGVLNELVKAGFLQTTTSQKKKKGLLGGRGRMVEVTHYSLTEAGKGVAVEADKLLMGRETRFCYGVYEVVDIERWTEPAVVWGKNVTEVKWSYRAQEIAEWVKTEGFAAQAPTLARDIEGKVVEGKAALILTNKGWVHEKLMQN